MDQVPELPPVAHDAVPEKAAPDCSLVMRPEPKSVAVLVGDVLKLGLPVILAMLSQTMVNIVDTMFVGRLPKDVATPAQSALGYCLPLLWLFGGSISAIGTGTQAIVARRYGEHNREAAGAVYLNSLVIAALVSLVSTVVGWIALPHIFRLLHDDPAVREIGTSYGRLRFIGILSMVGTFSCKAFYDGTERTWVHLVAAIVMNIVNAALAWLLIFGKLGLPAMGVFGAGLAALISSYVGFLAMVAFTLRPGDQRRYRPYRWRNLDGGISWGILRLSIPSAIATTVLTTGFLMVLWVVGRVDEIHASGAAHAAASKIIIDTISLCFVGCMGLGTATATLVSKSMGEGRPNLAERYGWTSMGLGAVVFGVIGAVEALFPAAAMSVFTTDPAVISVGVDALRLVALAQVLIATGLVATQCLFGAGNNFFVMCAEFILHFGVLIPFSYLLGIRFGLGMIGVWTAAVMYVLGLSGTMMLKFRLGGWKKIKI